MHRILLSFFLAFSLSLSLPHSPITARRKCMQKAIVLRLITFKFTFFEYISWESETERKQTKQHWKSISSIYLAKGEWGKINATSHLTLFGYVFSLMLDIESDSKPLFKFMAKRLCNETWVIVDLVSGVGGNSNRFASTTQACEKAHRIISRYLPLKRRWLV